MNANTSDEEFNRQIDQAMSTKLPGALSTKEIDALLDSSFEDPIPMDIKLEGNHPVLARIDEWFPNMDEVEARKKELEPYGYEFDVIISSCYIKDFLNGKLRIEVRKGSNKEDGFKVKGWDVDVYPIWRNSRGAIELGFFKDQDEAVQYAKDFIGEN